MKVIYSKYVIYISKNIEFNCPIFKLFYSFIIFQLSLNYSNTMSKVLLVVVNLPYQVQLVEIEIVEFD